MKTIIKKYEIEIVGIEGSPICWNVMKKELEEERSKLKKDELKDWEEKNWKRKAEFDDKGNIVIPERWLHSSLLNACMKSRMIPHFATSKNQTFTIYVGSFMVYNIGNGYKEKDLEYFGCYESSQGSKRSGKVWRIRPIIKKWKAKFNIIDPAGRMKKDELKTLLDYAGMYIGIGDARNRRFGRFELKNLKEAN